MKPCDNCGATAQWKMQRETLDDFELSPDGTMWLHVLTPKMEREVFCGLCGEVDTSEAWADLPTSINEVQS